MLDECLALGTLDCKVPKAQEIFMKTEILICVTCQPNDISRDAPRVGAKLYEAVNEQVFIDDLPYVVRPIECMGGCSRACTLAIQATGKSRYLFGNLDASPDSVNQTLLCARIHANDKKGLIAWGDRPPMFKNGLIARLPETLDTTVQISETLKRTPG
jgi:predicted metal-binding protein